MHASVTIQRDSEESRKKKSVSMDFLVPENIPAKRRACGTVAPQKKTVDLDSSSSTLKVHRIDSSAFG